MSRTFYANIKTLLSNISICFLVSFRSVLISLTVSRTGLLYLLIRQLHFVTDFVICVTVSLSVCVSVCLCVVCLFHLIFEFLQGDLWFCFGLGNCILRLFCNFVAEVWFQNSISTEGAASLSLSSSRKAYHKQPKLNFHHHFCLTPKNNETF